MEPDVDILVDFPAFFGRSKMSVLMEYPSEAPRLGMIGDSFFTTLQTIAPHAGDFDAAIKIMWGLFGHQRLFSVLDIGNAGLLTGLKLHFLGFNDVTVADLPSIYCDFLQFLCDKYDVPVVFETPEKALRNANNYTYVICQQAMSWTGEPITHLRDLRRVLTPAGFLFLAQLVNCHPLFTSDRALTTMEKHGFLPALEDAGQPKVFQRTR